MILWLLPAAVLFLLAWSYIRDFFTKVLIPCIRNTLGDTLAGTLSNLVFFIDAPVSIARDSVARAYHLFQKQFLGIQTTYHRVGIGQVECTTEVITRLNGKDRKTSLKSLEDWENLPLSLRKEFIRQNLQSAAIDQKAVIAEGVEQTAKRAEIPLTGPV